jgi:hypothetical protein
MEGRVMEARDLQAESFARYAPDGRAFAAQHVDLLRRIPLALLPLLLLQIQRYDVAFPAERRQLSAEMDGLEAMSGAAFDNLMQPFAALDLSPDLKRMDWVNRPQQFTERLTAWLWSQHRIDLYHAAAESYRRQLELLSPPPEPATARWTILLLGHGISHSDAPLFRKLAPLGTTFTNIDPAGGTEALMAEAVTRAERYPLPYGHWYIDGDEPIAAPPALTTVSYRRLAPAARREFDLLHRFSAGSNPAGQAAVETVSSYVAALTPEDVGLKGADAPLCHLEVSLLTQGACCQIFSTTFVQWAARECLHRAQPVTLVARFRTRQTMAPMEQLLARDPLSQPQDEQGSLVDADMGAYYTWINQSRLPGAEQARFLAWWEDRNLALVISPSMPRGSRSSASANMKQLLDWVR